MAGERVFRLDETGLARGRGMVQVRGGPDVADDHIVQHAAPGDLAIKRFANALDRALTRVSTPRR